jgi:hypothetical protein
MYGNVHRQDSGVSDLHLTLVQRGASPALPEARRCKYGVQRLMGTVERAVQHATTPNRQWFGQSNMHRAIGIIASGADTRVSPL